MKIYCYNHFWIIQLASVTCPILSICFIPIFVVKIKFEIIFKNFPPCFPLNLLSACLSQHRNVCLIPEYRHSFLLLLKYSWFPISCQFQLVQHSDSVLLQRLYSIVDYQIMCYTLNPLYFKFLKYLGVWPRQALVADLCCVNGVSCYGHALQLWLTGLAAPWHVGPCSPTRIRSTAPKLEGRFLATDHHLPI